MAIKQTVSGKIFEENFNQTTLDNSLWSFLPNNPGRFSLTERPGYLRMKHGTTNANLNLNTLIPDSFMINIDYDYAPLSYGDMAGIVIGAGDVKLELLDIYEEMGISTKTLRLVRQKEWWSAYYKTEDGAWNYSGAIIFDNAATMSISLMGTTGQNLDIDNISMSSGTGIRLCNIPEGWKVKLIGDITKEVIADKSGESIISLMDCNVPYNATIQVYDDKNNLAFNKTGLFWPGDEFQYNIDVEIKIDDTVLIPTSSYYIGNFRNNEILVDMLIINKEFSPVTNMTVRAKQIIDNSYQWVQFASFNDFDNTSSEWTDNLYIARLEAGETQTIKVKVVRASNFFAITAKDVEFMVEVSFGGLGV